MAVSPSLSLWVEGWGEIRMNIVAVPIGFGGHGDTP